MVSGCGIPGHSHLRFKEFGHLSDSVSEFVISSRFLSI